MAPSHFSTAVNGVYSRVDIPQTQVRAPGEPETRAAGGIASTEFGLHLHRDDQSTNKWWLDPANLRINNSSWVNNG